MARPAAAPQRVRIIGGFWRSRLLKVADAPGLRPTTDRVRETLFNWLGLSLEGSLCLDMFAGTGSLGLESASRGAKKVTLLEANPLAHQVLQANLAQLGELPPNCDINIIRTDAMAWAKKQAGQKFDTIFIDPPFIDSDSLLKAIVLAEHLSIKGTHSIIYVECPSELSEDLVLESLPGWHIARQMIAGAAKAMLIRRNPL